MLSGQIVYNSNIPAIVARFTLFVEDLMVGRAGCVVACVFSSWCSCDFGSFADFTIRVLREVHDLVVVLLTAFGMRSWTTRFWKK